MRAQKCKDEGKEKHKNEGTENRRMRSQEYKDEGTETHKTEG
jgi:hypothetical protein